MTIVADTAGDHDLGFPACSEFEYEELTGLAGHANCHDLLAGAVAAAGAEPARVHDPLNLWLPSEVDPSGTLRSWPVAARRGDFVELRAHARVLAAFCPCPDDLFGSSQFDPAGIRVRVRNPKTPGRDVASGWIVTSPAPSGEGGIRSVVEVDIPGHLAGHLEDLRDFGWLGFDITAVARALALRSAADASAARQRISAGGAAG